MNSLSIDTMRMRRRTVRSALWGMALAAALLLAGSAQAWQSDREPTGSPDELQTAMQEYFAKRLRAELSLSDDQFEEIVPLVRQMEETKRAVQRTRMESVRRLRRGLQQGAPDEELQRALDELERAERDQQDNQRTMLSKIDRVLSTRQRVQLRFFTQRFRRDIQDKVRELRGERERDTPRRQPRRNRP